MWNPAEAANPQYVPYRDFKGLNTKTDPHALQRNELQLSQNMWNISELIIGKRPGNVNFASGTTGDNAAGNGLTAARYGNNTEVIAQVATTKLYFAKQTDLSFTAISTAIGGGTIRSAQMFDPDDTGSGADTTFIVNGVDTPWMWTGPTSTTLAAVATGAGKIPTNHTNAAPITPKYVATSMGKLFYAGEPTEPSAVYVSDPFFPERFTGSALLTGGIVAGSYVPYFPGRNDGVDGGDITGIEPLGQTMLVYKSSAIYRMDFGFAIFGDTLYQVSPVSVSVGATSPRSIVRFDTYHAFLGIDGVYTTDGISTIRISDNVPTFYDGPAAVILDRTTAVGARMGNKYLLFYDAGANGVAGVGGTPAGYPTRGMWFDFSKLDNDGYPSAGEIMGMNVNGAVAMRGPKDVGNMVWIDGSTGGGVNTRIGQFNAQSGGTIVYSDFGNAILSTMTGKSDYMAEFFDPGAPLKNKWVDAVTLEIGVPAQVVTSSLFTVTLTRDIFSDLSNAGSTVPLPGAGGVVGTAIVGTDIVGGGEPGQYQIVKVPMPKRVTARVVSISVSENSTNPWNLLGYDLLVNAHEVEQ